MNEATILLPIEEKAVSDLFDNPVPHLKPVMIQHHPLLYVRRSDELGFYREGWLVYKSYQVRPEPGDYPLKYFFYDRLGIFRTTHAHKPHEVIQVRDAVLKASTFEALLEKGRQIPVPVVGILERKMTDAGYNQIRWYNPKVSIEWHGMPDEWQALGDWYDELTHYFEFVLNAAGTSNP